MARVGLAGVVRCGVLCGVPQVDQLAALAEHRQRAAAAYEGVALERGAWRDVGRCREI